MATTYTVQAGDTLNGIAAKHGFNTYKDAGITSVPSGNFNLVRPGDVLTLGNASAPSAQKTSASSSSPSVSTPTPSTTPAAQTGPQSQTDTLHQLINGSQASDMEAVSAPATTSSTPPDFLTSLTNTLKQTIGTAPTAPALTDTYQKLKADAAVTDLETRLNDLTKQSQDLLAIKNERVANERDKRVAQGVIEGRVSQVERQENERLQSVESEKAYVSDQLQTKYTAINQIMQYTQQDYENVKSSYDTKFSQAVTMINAAREAQSDQQSLAEHQETSARANLQVIYNSISNGTTDLSTMDGSQKTLITKLEAQAGLPTGFFETLKAENPEGKVLTTTSYTTQDGKKYTDVIIQNKDGSLKKQSVYHGVTGTSSSAASVKSGSAVISANEIGTVSQDLAKSRGDDGWTDPTKYLNAYNSWINEGGLLKDFLSHFPPVQYVNPANDWLPQFLRNTKKTEDMSGESVF